MTRDERPRGDEHVGVRARALFDGPGEMRARCRALDWRATALGDPREWPSSLRTTAESVLARAFPAIVLWGPDLVQLYNDAYVPFLGVKHPAGLGQPTRECWPEVWHINAPIYARVHAGETVFLEDAHFPLRRQGEAGPLEDLYLTLSYDPVHDEAGDVGGVCITIVDTTAQVLGRSAVAERRRLEARLHGALLETALVLDQVRDAYLVLSADFRIVAVNQSAERALGRSREALVGRTHWEAFPASVGAEPERQYRRVAAEGVEAHFVHHYVGEGYDFHLEIDAYPTGEGGVAIFWRDISERLRLLAEAEVARADAEARAATLAAVIDSIPDAVLVGHADALTLANRAALEQLGAPTLEALRTAAPETGLSLEDVLLDPDTGAVVPLAATPIGRAPAGERSHGQFLLRARGTDVTRPVRAAAAPIAGPDGMIRGAVAVLTDMTRVRAAAAERERLLAALDAERTLLRTVLDQMPAAVFIVEAPSGRILALNDAVARVWGEPRPHTDAVSHYSEEWVGYHLDGRRIASDEWPIARAVLGSETVTDWVGEIERPDGTRVTIEVSAAPVRDAAGRTVAAVAVAADITARARGARERDLLLRELEVERARLAHVFQQSPTFLAVLRGPTHVFELVNAAYTQLVGRRALMGKSVDEALPEVREQGFITLLDRVLATGEPFVGREVPVVLGRTPGAAPEPRFVDFVYLPIVEADGSRSGIIAHGSDVTEQVEARREIERLLAESERARLDAEAARAEAQAANRTKGEFLAVMSHELRTPLNAIGGYVELIELGIRGPVTAQQREDLARIQKSQRHLLGLINGVLNYSRAEAGAVHYDVGDVPLAPVLATCETLIAPQARAKGISLRFAACQEPLTVRGDREKVQQILVNLLSNAVKFTAPGGEVTLDCQPDRGRSGAPAVVVTVADTGRGIATDQLERVFEPFVQVDTRLTRTEEGMGLGLAISRDLARGMGGDLTAESTLGAGSTFTLTLPAA
ncbi:MAG TPA: PAS domain-containing protein [Gemmatirosa sp.]|nr:PAS domain-containing protein [Gemmatirosa sp.]